MPTLTEALASLERSLGAEPAAAVLRRLAHVPGAVEWLLEPAVAEVVVEAARSDRSLPRAVVLAAAGASELTLPRDLPPGRKARLSDLLQADDPGPIGPDDLRLLAGHLLETEAEGGAESLVAAMRDSGFDWSGPLAAAWPGLKNPVALVAAAVSEPGSQPLRATLAALRAQGPEDQVAAVLSDAGSASPAQMLARLLTEDEAELAATVAARVASTSDEPLVDQLHHGWETGRSQLALLADAIAIAADRAGDFLSADEARRQAIALAPSDERLAAAALARAGRGDAASAFDLLPPEPDAPALRYALGVALLSGGAFDRARELVTAAATHALEQNTQLVPHPAMVSHLRILGETDLAGEVMAEVVRRHPTDPGLRLGYAQVLREAGRAQDSLAQAALARALDPGSASEARRLEVDSLSDLGQASAAYAAWKDLPASDVPADWRKTVELALRAGSNDEASSLLDRPAADVSPVDVATLRARLLAAQGHVDGAIGLLEAAASEHPTSPELWRSLAEIHQAAGHPGGEIDSLRRGCQMAPGIAPLQAALSRALLDQGRHSEALTAARKALELDPDLPTAHLHAGGSLLALGRSREAVDHLRSAHRARPGSIETRLALARGLEAVGEIRHAAQLLNHLADNAPAEAWLLSGRLALADAESRTPESASRAAGKLLRARRLGATDPRLALLLGQAFEAAGTPDRAIEHYREYLAAPHAGGDTVRQASLRAAACLMAKGATAEAVRQLEDLRNLEGDLPAVLEPLAEAYLAASLPSDAAAAAQALLGRDPVNRKALQVVARAARLSGNWEAASQAIQEAAHRHSGDVELLTDAGEAALRVGQMDAALGWISRALESSPDHAGSRRLAQLLIEAGQAKQALSVIRAAAAARPDAADAWLEAADIAERAGDRMAMIEALDRIASLQPSDPSTHLRLAQALWDHGRRSEAIGSWQKAADLDPADPVPQRALAEALIANGEVDSGLARFSKALEANPRDPSLLTGAGLAALAHASPLEAADRLQAALQEQPSNLRAVLGLAEARLRSGHPDLAEATLRSLPARALATPHASSLLAEAHLAMGDLEAAREAIVTARRSEPDGPNARIALSRAELRLGHWSEALTVLTPVLTSQDPAPRHALAETILRVLESEWLYAGIAFASRHAPGPHVVGEPRMQWLRGFVEGGSQAQLAASARLGLWESADDDESLASLAAHRRPGAAGNPDSEAEARAHLIRGQSDQALQVLRRITPDALGLSWQALLAGIAHLQRGHYDLALSALEDASSDAALRPLGLALASRAHHSAGNLTEAIAALNHAIGQWPDEPTWQHDLARLYLEQDAPEAALPHLQAAVELEPENPEVIQDLARTLRQNGHLADALHTYERLLPLRPGLSQVWSDAGALALNLGDFSRAAGYYDKALELAPESAEVRTGASQAALGVGKLRQARHHAEAAVRLGPDLSAAHLALAEVTARQGDLDRALELVDRAEAVSEDSRPLTVFRSRLLLEADRPAQACDVLRKHLSGAPGDLAAHRLLSQALESDGDLTGAAETLELAIEHAPRSADLHLRLARLSRKSGQLDRALDEIRQVEGLSPLEPGLALEQGLVHEARREFDRALEAYRRAVEIEPDDAEGFRRAGAVLKSIKAYPEAGRMLARAAQLDPDPTTLQQLAAVRALELVHGGSPTLAVNP